MTSQTAHTKYKWPPYANEWNQARNQKGAIGQLPPEIFTNVCICMVQQQVTSFCPSRKDQLVAALNETPPMKISCVRHWSQHRNVLEVTGSCHETFYLLLLLRHDGNKRCATARQSWADINFCCSSSCTRPVAIQSLCWATNYLFYLPTGIDTTAASIFANLPDNFSEHGVMWLKWKIVSTDGARATVGIRNGVVALIKQVAPEVVSRAGLSKCGARLEAL